MSKWYLAVLIMISISFLISACGGSGSGDLPMPNERAAGGPDQAPPPPDTPTARYGEPSSTEQPQAPEGNLVRDGVTITGADLLIMESFPIQVALQVSGEKATVCHILRSRIDGPDEENRILVELFTLYDPGKICIMMVDAFEEHIPIPMQGAANGVYSVWLNGERVGEFTYPGG